MQDLITVAAVLIRERTKAGMAAAKKRGSKIGRPRACVDLHMALKMKGEGKSVREIAKALGVGVGTVQRALLRGLGSGTRQQAEAASSMS